MILMNTGRLCRFIALAALAAAITACSNPSNDNTIPGRASAAHDSSAPAPSTVERVNIREFADLPQYYSGGYSPSAIASLDGTLWVTDTIDQDSGSNVVAEIAISGKRTNAYYYNGVTSEGSDLYDIAAGPDGALWLTDYYNRQILRMTTGGTYTSFPLSDFGTPASIARGPDNALWFTEYTSSGPAIGRITTKGKITTFTAGISSGTDDIAAGPDGATWFTETSGDRIGRITTHGSVTEYSNGISPGSEPYSIALGPDGAMWFTELTGGRIGRITTAGKVTEYSRGITPSEEPNDLAAGPDGAMWFSEYESYSSYRIHDSKIGRIKMNGKITEYANLNPQSAPTAITAGPDGNMWFVASGVDRTGRIKL